MTNTDKLHDGLQKAVDAARSTGITYAEVIGTIELFKQALILTAFQETED